MEKETKRHELACQPTCVFLGNIYSSINIMIDDTDRGKTEYHLRIASRLVTREISTQYPDIAAGV